MGQTEGEKSWELEKGMRERSEPVGGRLGSRGRSGCAKKVVEGQ